MRFPIIKNPEIIYCNIHKIGQVKFFAQVNSRHYFDAVNALKVLNNYLVKKKSLQNDPFVDEAFYKEIANIADASSITQMNIKPEITKESLGNKKEIWRANIVLSLIKAILWSAVLFAVFIIIRRNNFSGEAKIIEIMMKFIAPPVLIILIFLIFGNRIEVYKNGLYIKTTINRSVVIPYKEIGYFSFNATVQKVYFIKTGTLYTWFIVGNDGKEIVRILSSQIYKLHKRMKGLKSDFRKEGKV